MMFIAWMVRSAPNFFIIEHAFILSRVSARNDVTLFSLVLHFILKLCTIITSNIKWIWANQLTSIPLNLSYATTCISESCIKIKINLNFYFHTSLWCLKRFYEGFKSFIKHFEAPQRNMTIKIEVYFLSWSGIGTGRVIIKSKIWRRSITVVLRNTWKHNRIAKIFEKL